MNFHGSEAISRSTRVTGRTVLLMSFLLVLATKGWISLAENTLLGIKLQEDIFMPLLAALCVASIISHAVQWYGDYLSYKGWNIEGKLPGMPRSSASSKNRLHDLGDTIARLASMDADGATMSKEFEQLSKQVQDLDKSMIHFGLYAKFYVFGWHLGLPVGAACLSLVIYHA